MTLMVVFLLSKINTWGYSTINFFSPMSSYASAGGRSVNASREFKEMVKALHSSGIEVVMLILHYHNFRVELCLIFLFPGFVLFYIISSLIYTS